MLSASLLPSLLGLIRFKVVASDRAQSMSQIVTLLYFKMAVMPLVLETKKADVSKLISLGNLLVRKTTWLVLATTSSTSISSSVFGVKDCL